MIIRFILLFLVVPLCLSAAQEPTAPVISESDLNAAATVYMTPVFPGWGQLHGEGGWRPVAAFGIGMHYWSRMVMYDRKAKRLQAYIQSLEPGSNRDYYESQVTEYWELMRDFGWWGFGVAFLTAVDAYVGANLHNFDSDPVPVPDSWDPAELPQAIELPNSSIVPGVVLAQWGFEF